MKKESSNGGFKKIIKVLAVFAMLLIVGIPLWIANAFVGNPASKILAKNAVQEYIAETYPQRDFVIEGVHYNFKISAYHASIISPSSIDTYFSVTTSMKGEIKRDDYEHVLSGWNTYRRIDDAYRERVNKVFTAEDFPIVSHIDYGEINMMDKDQADDFNGVNYGINMGDLELDKEYDINELAKRAGHIVYYAQDEEISFDRASEMLLQLKDCLDEADVPFYAIDFVLEKPRDEEGKVNRDRNEIRTKNILYSDIHEEGLVERVEQAHNELTAYYEMKDKEREGKIKE